MNAAVRFTASGPAHHATGVLTVCQVLPTLNLPISGRIPRRKIRYLISINEL